MSCVLTGCDINATGYGVLTANVVDDVVISENSISSQADGVGIGGSANRRMKLHHNTIDATGHGINSAGSSSFCEIDHNTIRQPGANGIWMQGAQQCVIQGNIIEDPGEHGIYLDDVDDCVITDNLITNPGISNPNTFDGVNLENDSSNNLIHHNKVLPDTGGPGDTRYGINVSDSSCDCNAVVGNYLGDSTFYGTAPLQDLGTGTWLVYPNDPTWGDNFVDCGGSA